MPDLLTISQFINPFKGCTIYFAPLDTNQIIMKQIKVDVPSLKAFYPMELDLNNPSKFIGEVLNQSRRQTFNLNGCTITVPAETPNNDFHSRGFQLYIFIINAIFAGCDNETVYDDTTEQGQFCEGLKSKGFVMSHNSKAAATTAVTIWLKAKKATVLSQVLATQNLNVAKFAIIDAANKVNKSLAADLKAGVKAFIEASK